MLLAVGPGFSRVPSVTAVRSAAMHCVPAAHPGNASIVGTIELPPEAAPGNIFIGVFGESIPQCAPVAYKYMHNVGSSTLAIHDVPPGRWVVIAVAESRAAGGSPVLLGSQREAVTVTSGGTTRVRLRLRGQGPIDPPLAIALAARLTGDPDPASVRQRRVLPAVA
jgi:hypothetical protein